MALVQTGPDNDPGSLAIVGWFRDEVQREVAGARELPIVAILRNEGAAIAGVLRGSEGPVAIVQPFDDVALSRGIADGRARLDEGVSLRDDAHVDLTDASLREGISPLALESALPGLGSVTSVASLATTGQFGGVVQALGAWHAIQEVGDQFVAHRLSSLTSQERDSLTPGGHVRIGYGSEGASLDRDDGRDPLQRLLESRGADREYAQDREQLVGRDLGELDLGDRELGTIGAGEEPQLRHRSVDLGERSLDRDGARSDSLELEQDRDELELSR